MRPPRLITSSLLAALSALPVLSPPAAAQGQPARPALADPMRPPPGMPLSTRPGAAGGLPAALPGFLPPTAAAVPMLAAPAPALAAASRPAPAEKPRLQALHRPHEGEASVMIDGRILKIGDRLGALTIAEIDAEGIVLRGPKGSERLNLLAPDTRRAPAEPAREAPDAAPSGGPATHVAGRKEP